MKSMMCVNCTAAKVNNTPRSEVARRGVAEEDMVVTVVSFGLRATGGGG